MNVSEESTYYVRFRHHAIKAIYNQEWYFHIREINTILGYSRTNKLKTLLSRRTKKIIEADKQSYAPYSCLREHLMKSRNPVSKELIASLDSFCSAPQSVMPSAAVRISMNEVYTLPGWNYDLRMTWLFNELHYILEDLLSAAGISTHIDQIYPNYSVLSSEIIHHWNPDYTEYSHLITHKNVKKLLKTRQKHEIFAYLEQIYPKLCCKTQQKLMK